MALNKVLLIGNVGKDPEVRHLEGGASVATITLATTERFKDKSGTTKELTEWHTIVAWRQLADLAENYIRKGSQIYVEGRIRSRSYDDQNGIKRYVTEILADGIQLLGKKPDNAVPTQGAYAPPASYQAPVTPAAQVADASPAPASESSFDDSADDLPF